MPLAQRAGPFAHSRAYRARRRGSQPQPGPGSASARSTRVRESHDRAGGAGQSLARPYVSADRSFQSIDATPHPGEQVCDPLPWHCPFPCETTPASFYPNVMRKATFPCKDQRFPCSLFPYPREEGEERWAQYFLKFSVISFLE